MFMHEIVNIKKKKVPSRNSPKNSIDLLNFFVLFFSELCYYNAIALQIKIDHLYSSDLFLNCQMAHIYKLVIKRLFLNFSTFRCLCYEGLFNLVITHILGQKFCCGRSSNALQDVQQQP